MSFFTRFCSRRNKFFFLHLHCNIHKGNYTWNCTENVRNSHSKWNWKCFCWNERCISISKLYHRGESFVSCSIRGYTFVLFLLSICSAKRMWFLVSSLLVFHLRVVKIQFIAYMVHLILVVMQRIKYFGCHQKLKAISKISDINSPPYCWL